MEAEAHGFPHVSTTSLILAADMCQDSVALLPLLLCHLGRRQLSASISTTLLNFFAHLFVRLSGVLSLRRDCGWRDPEIYITLVLDIVYAYNALMLLFGLAHCCSLLCGARPLMSTSLLRDPSMLGQNEKHASMSSVSRVASAEDRYNTRCRCHNKGPVCGPESLCRAAMYGSAQPTESDSQLEARLLWACPIEAGSWRQIAPRRQFTGVAGQWARSASDRHCQS